MSCGGAGGRRDGTQVRTADLAKVSHDRLLAEVRKKLRQELRFPADGSAMGVQCVFSAEPPVFPQPDGSVCAMRSRHQRHDGATRLNCNGGLGSATFVTGAFGFAAAGLIVRQIAGKGRRTATTGRRSAASLPNPAEHALEISFDAHGERLDCFAEQFRQAGINRDQIRRMIQWLAVRASERMKNFFLRQKLVGRVGLDQQTIRGNVFEGFALRAICARAKNSREN